MQTEQNILEKVELAAAIHVRPQMTQAQDTFELLSLALAKYFHPAKIILQSFTIPIIQLHLHVLTVRGFASFEAEIKQKFNYIKEDGEYTPGLVKEVYDLQTLKFHKTIELALSEYTQRNIEVIALHTSDQSSSNELSSEEEEKREVEFREPQSNQFNQIVDIMPIRRYIRQPNSSEFENYLPIVLRIVNGYAKTHGSVVQALYKKYSQGREFKVFIFEAYTIQFNQTFIFIVLANTYPVKNREKYLNMIKRKSEDFLGDVNHKFSLKDVIILPEMMTNDEILQLLQKKNAFIKVAGTTSEFYKMANGIDTSFSFNNGPSASTATSKRCGFEEEEKLETQSFASAFPLSASQQQETNKEPQKEQTAAKLSVNPIFYFAKQCQIAKLLTVPTMEQFKQIESQLMRVKGEKESKVKGIRAYSVDGSVYLCVDFLDQEYKQFFSPLKQSAGVAVLNQLGISFEPFKGRERKLFTELKPAETLFGNEVRLKEWLSFQSSQKTLMEIDPNDLSEKRWWQEVYGKIFAGVYSTINDFKNEYAGVFEASKFASDKEKTINSFLNDYRRIFEKKLTKEDPVVTLKRFTESNPLSKDTPLLNSMKLGERMFTALQAIYDIFFRKADYKRGTVLLHGASNVGKTRLCELLKVILHCYEYQQTYSDFSSALKDMSYMPQLIIMDEATVKTLLNPRRLEHTKRTFERRGIMLDFKGRDPGTYFEGASVLVTANVYRLNEFITERLDQDAVKNRIIEVEMNKIIPDNCFPFDEVQMAHYLLYLHDNWDKLTKEGFLYNYTDQRQQQKQQLLGKRQTRSPRQQESIKNLFSKRVKREDEEELQEPYSISDESSEENTLTQFLQIGRVCNQEIGNDTANQQQQQEQE